MPRTLNTEVDWQGGPRKLPRRWSHHNYYWYEYKNAKNSTDAGNPNVKNMAHKFESYLNGIHFALL